MARDRFWHVTRRPPFINNRGRGTWRTDRHCDGHGRGRAHERVQLTANPYAKVQAEIETKNALISAGQCTPELLNVNWGGGILEPLMVRIDLTPPSRRALRG